MDGHYLVTNKFFEQRVKNSAGRYHPAKSPTAWAQRRIKTIALNLTKRSDIRPSEKILDAGCAYGLFTGELGVQFKTADIVGIDFSPGMIRLAKENVKLPNVSFYKADLLKLNFQPKVFEITFCLDTLHHILPADLEKVLIALARVTRKELILEIKNRGLAKRITKRLGRLRSINIYETKKKNVNNIMNKAGFRLVGVKPILGVEAISPITLLRFIRED